MVKLPFASVLVATVDPLTETVAPAKGKLFGSVIFPVTVFCAKRTLLNNNSRAPNITLNEVDLAIIIVSFLICLKVGSQAFKQTI